jgi:hypothetical protein
VTHMRYSGIVLLICVGIRFLSLAWKAPILGDRGDPGKLAALAAFQLVWKSVFPCLSNIVREGCRGGC